MVEHRTVTSCFKTLESNFTTKEEHADLSVDIEDKVYEEKFAQDRLRDMLRRMGNHLDVFEFGHEMESSDVSYQEDDSQLHEETVLG